ncbi:MAG: hypothetical protein Fur002_22560 [Anaerolineales bacterium]
MNMTSRRLFLILFTLLFLTAACQPRVEQNLPAGMTAQPTQTLPPVVATRTLLPAPTETPLPTSTPAPAVIIRAVKGNLFIRRGPDMAYNPIGVLYEGSSAAVLGHDPLFKWAQVNLPNGGAQGWVSLQTQYSQVDGDLNAAPQVSVTDFPQAAYLRNCTHHRMYILPGDFYLESSYSVENLIWLYPGHYVVYDMDMPDLVEVAEVDMREGATIDVRVDGAGEKRKCE